MFYEKVPCFFVAFSEEFQVDKDAKSKEKEENRGAEAEPKNEFPLAEFFLFAIFACKTAFTGAFIICQRLSPEEGIGIN